MKAGLFVICAILAGLTYTYAQTCNSTNIETCLSDTECSWCGNYCVSTKYNAISLYNGPYVPCFRADTDMTNTAAMWVILGAVASYLLRRLVF